MHKILLFICIGIFFFMPCRAEEAVFSAADGVSPESLADIRALADGFDFRTAAEEGTGNLWDGLREGIAAVLGRTLRENMAIPFLASSLSIIGGMLYTLCPESTGEASSLLFCILTVGLSLSSLTDAAEACRRTAEDMSVFVNAAAPALAAMSAGGTAVSPLLLLSGNAASLLISRVGIPAQYAALALSVSASLGGGKPIKGLASLITRISLWAVCGIFSILGAVIGILGYGAGTLGTVAVKSAKYAAGTLVPVLGSMLSEAADAVGMSTLLIRNTAGTAGMAFILFLTLTPVLRLGITAVLYRLAACISSVSTDGRISGALSDMADILSALVGMTAAAGVLCILSVGMLIRSASAGVM